MVHKILFATLTVFFILSFGVAAQAQSSASDTAKTKAKITKLGVGAPVTIVQHGGKTFHGALAQIGPDTFTVSEVDLKANVEIRYDQVKHLDKGYSPASPITGQRQAPKTRKILGLAALGGLVVSIVLVIVALSSPD